MARGCEETLRGTHTPGRPDYEHQVGRLLSELHLHSALAFPPTPSPSPATILPPHSPSPFPLYPDLFSSLSHHPHPAPPPPSITSSLPLPFLTSSPLPFPFILPKHNLRGLPPPPTFLSTPISPPLSSHPHITPVALISPPVSHSPPAEPATPNNSQAYCLSYKLLCFLSSPHSTRLCPFSPSYTLFLILFPFHPSFPLSPNFNFLFFFLRRLLLPLLFILILYRELN